MFSFFAKERINLSFSSFKVHTPYFCRTNIPHGAGIDHQAGHFLCQASLPSPPGNQRLEAQATRSAGIESCISCRSMFIIKVISFTKKSKPGGGWQQFGSHPDDWYPTQSKQEIITETKQPTVQHHLQACLVRLEGTTKAIRWTLGLAD